MRRIVFSVLSLIMFATVTPIYADDVVSVNPSFDFTGVEEFWKIADILKADQEPPASQWEKLFSTPGYKTLVSMEVGNPNIFKNALRAAFMPSQETRAEELVAEAKEKSDMLASYTAYIIATYRTADANHVGLAKRVEELKTYPYAKLAKEDFVKFLPTKNITTLTKVVFIVHHASPNYSPTIIGLNGLELLAQPDIQRLESCGKNKHWPFVLELARRSFLQYRQQKLAIKYPDYSDRDFPIVRMIDQIAGEAIAAQIDVRQMYFNQGCFADTDRARELRELQSRQPSVIRELDTILSAADKKSASVGELASITNDLLVRSGVPVAFFMAHTIVEELGEDELTTVSLNPFAFFLLYDKAAKIQKSAPVFSENTIKHLKKLEFRHEK